MKTKTFTVEAHCANDDVNYGPTHARIEVSAEYAARIRAMVAFAAEGKKRFETLAWIEFRDYAPDWIDSGDNLATDYDQEEMRWECGRILVEPDGDLHWDAIDKYGDYRWCTDTINVKDLADIEDRG